MLFVRGGGRWSEPVLSFQSCYGQGQPCVVLAVWINFVLKMLVYFEILHLCGSLTKNNIGILNLYANKAPKHFIIYTFFNTFFSSDTFFILFFRPILFFILFFHYENTFFSYFFFRPPAGSPVGIKYGKMWHTGLAQSCLTHEPHKNKHFMLFC